MSEKARPNHLRLVSLDVGEFAVQTILDVPKVWDEIKGAREQMPDNVFPIFPLHKPDSPPNLAA